MELKPIDHAGWPRREHFYHFLKAANRCTYSITDRLDVSAFLDWLKDSGRKFYPAFTWVVSRAVNNHFETRMGLFPDGTPGVYARMDPAYTTFHEGTRTFSVLSTPFNPDFSGFYRAMCEDIQAFEKDLRMMPRPLPNNAFNVSSAPWQSFTGLNMNVYDEGTVLAPVVLWGRFERDGERTTMPLAFQIHHAACDGYHAARFFEELRGMLAAPGQFCRQRFV